MAKYTNIGTTNITVRGITIKPGETKDLKGFANDRNLLRCGSKSSDVKPKKKFEEKSSDSNKVQPVQTDIKKEDKANVKTDGQ